MGEHGLDQSGLWYGQEVGFGKGGNELSGSTKLREFLDLTSQEELCSMD
jgi:hypothetical protein